jgi:hypothetical protein
MEGKPNLYYCEWSAHWQIEGWQNDLAWEMDERARLAAEGPRCSPLCKCMGWDVEMPDVYGEAS